MNITVISLVDSRYAMGALWDDEIIETKELISEIGSEMVVLSDCMWKVMNEANHTLPEAMTVFVTAASKKQNVPDEVKWFPSTRAAIAAAADFKKRVFLLGGTDIIDGAIHDRFVDKIILITIPRLIESPIMFPSAVLKMFNKSYEHRLSYDTTSAAYPVIVSVYTKSH